MPITVSVDSHSRIVRAVATGMISVADVLAFLPTARPGKLRSYGLLVDATGARTSIIGSEMSEIVQESRATIARGSSGPIGIVANRSIVGLARMYAMLLEPSPVRMRIFAESGYAESWLRSQS